jgi:hypothetical protein
MHTHLDDVVRSDRLLADGEEPDAGAHLITPRLGFTHHGIYVGGGKVVHYGTLARRLQRRPVEEVPIDRFANDHRVWVRQHERVSFEPAQIIKRARSRIGEDRYGLLSNNCEHFCEWCLHDVPFSYQVRRVRTFARGLTGAVTTLGCVLVTLLAVSGIWT